MRFPLPKTKFEIEREICRDRSQRAIVAQKALSSARQVQQSDGSTGVCGLSGSESRPPERGGSAESPLCTGRRRRRRRQIDSRQWERASGLASSIGRLPVSRPKGWRAIYNRLYISLAVSPHGPRPVDSSASEREPCHVGSGETDSNSTSNCKTGAVKRDANANRQIELVLSLSLSSKTLSFPLSEGIPFLRELAGTNLKRDRERDSN